MSIEQTIGQEQFNNLVAMIRNAINKRDITGVIHTMEIILERAFRRGQENSAAMRAAGFPLRVAGVKKNTTELVTAGLVDDLEEGDGFHVKPGIPSVIHADSASEAGVGRLIQAERDRERHRIARDLKSSSSQPPPLGYRPDPPGLDESNPPGGGSGVPVLGLKDEPVLPNITPTDLFAGLAMAALIIRDGVTAEQKLGEVYASSVADIAKRVAEEIRKG